MVYHENYSKTLSLRNQTLETQRYNLAPVSYAMLETGWLVSARSLETERNCVGAPVRLK